ncbi:MAG: hypothetical protein QMC67_06640 [Candidatus Wallbacteria bacterium]
MSEKNCITNLRANKVKIEFSQKKLTAYGGFSLFAAFFEQIKLKDFFELIIYTTYKKIKENLKKIGFSV